jgi:hypothetical protein
MDFADCSDDVLYIITFKSIPLFMKDNLQSVITFSFSHLALERWIIPALPIQQLTI